MTHPLLSRAFSSLLVTATIGLASAADVTVATGSVTPFNAVVYDQFGNPMAAQPTVNWNTTIGLLSTTTGPNTELTAPALPGTGTLSATSGSLLASSSIAVEDVPVVTTWTENFALADGTTQDNGDTAWSISPDIGSRAAVDNGRLHYSNTDQLVEWTSEPIAIGGSGSLSMDLESSGGFEPEDVLTILVAIDGGSPQQLAHFSNGFATQSPTWPLSGNQAVVIIRGDNSSTNEHYYIDNIAVTGSGGGTDNPPTASIDPVATVTDNDDNGSEAVTVTQASSDDNGITDYSWAIGASEVGTAASLTYNFPVGDTTLTLTVTDTIGQTDSDTVTVTVLSAPIDNPPTASIDPVATVTDNDDNGSEAVTVTQASSDDNGIAAYSWTIAASEIGTAASLTYNFPVGDTDLTLTVTDTIGQTDSDVVTVTVLPGGGGGETWTENFALADGTTQDNGDTAWSISPDIGNRAAVLDGRLNLSNTDQIVEWRSESITISGSGTVAIDLSSEGGFETSDSLTVLVASDGAAPQVLEEFIGAVPTDYYIWPITGTAVEIIIRGINSSGREDYYIDNVEVEAAVPVDPG